jgi:hypothetical protein
LSIFRQYLYYLNNFNENIKFQFQLLCSDGDTANSICTVCIVVIRTSPWRWQGHRSKHVGENIVNTIHREYWGAFGWLFCVVWIWLMHGRQTERVYKVLMYLIFIKHKSSGLCSMQCAMCHIVICGLYSCTVLLDTILFYILPHTVSLCVLSGSENKQRLFPYTELTVFRTHFSYIKDVYVFRELVFSRLILVYFAYLCIKIHNIDHTISEYQLL